jgi:thiol:disulfide interchange protein DsbD
MARFKQLMAFPMFATCVWLLWVLSQQIDENGVAGTLGALVLFGMAAWALGLAQRGARGFRWVAAASAALAVYAVVAATDAGTSAVARTTGAESSAWKPWSAAALEGELRAGRPVFVDFTAAWCVTCQANKRLVLNRRTIATDFAEKRVVLMRADWTSRDPAITQELGRFQRNGVPLYVLYDGRGGVRILPELLTENAVRSALAAL